MALAAGSLAYVAVDQNVMRLRSTLYRPAYGNALMVAAYALLITGILAGAMLHMGV